MSQNSLNAQLWVDLGGRRPIDLLSLDILRLIASLLSTDSYDTVTMCLMEHLGDTVWWCAYSCVSLSGRLW